ncbi:MAG: hypothetical protein M1813_003764 [Trichoglossum hirsutum]|nr:MAG: hypothetical protein M1813_003764 [Trichoglossum hirsutum]
MVKPLIALACALAIQIQAATATPIEAIQLARQSNGQTRCYADLNLWPTRDCNGPVAATKRVTSGVRNHQADCATLQPDGPARGFLSFRVAGGDFSVCLEREQLFVYAGNTCQPSILVGGGGYNFMHTGGCTTVSWDTTFSSARIFTQF